MLVIASLFVAPQALGADASHRRVLSMKDKELIEHCKQYVSEAHPWRARQIRTALIGLDLALQNFRHASVEETQQARLALHLQREKTIETCQWRQGAVSIPSAPKLLRKRAPSDEGVYTSAKHVTRSDIE